MKYTLSVFLMCLSSLIYAQAELVDRVIARVGTEYILLSDVEEQYQYTKLQKPDITEDARCEILQNIIAQKVIIYQAILDSVEVSDAEVQTQLDLRFDYTLRQMNGDEEFFKEYYGATVREMKERYREDQKQQILAERMQQKLITEVTITPKEVKEFYHSMPKDSLPFLDSEVELGEIVMKPIISQKSKDEAREKLQGILGRIRSGEVSFEEMALKHSQDPGSGSRGGDLGFAKRGTYVPEFEATVYNLDKNEISELVETQFGYHIIKMIERRGNNIRAKHILIKPEITQDDIDKTMAKLDSIKMLIEQDSLSFAKAVRQYSDEDAESYNNNGRLKNPRTGGSIFETDVLDPDVYFEIIDLEVGEFTKPAAFKTRSGDENYRILLLQSMTKPHQINLKQDYDKLTRLAKENKKAQYFENWLQTKMKEIYISVDEKFDNCPQIQELQSK